MRLAPRYLLVLLLGCGGRPAPLDDFTDGGARDTGGTGSDARSDGVVTECVPGAQCASGPGLCCDRDCDPATQQSCRQLCPLAPPADPVCRCQGPRCSEVRCPAGMPCPELSHCDGQRCIVTPRCLQESVGCVAFFSHCNCEWRCVDADAPQGDCPALCPDEQNLKYFPPLCDCGAGGCGMRSCSDPNECGFGRVCRQLPGSRGQSACADCAVCGGGGGGGEPPP